MLEMSTYPCLSENHVLSLAPAQSFLISFATFFMSKPLLTNKSTLLG